MKERFVDNFARMLRFGVPRGRFSSSGLELKQAGIAVLALLALFATTAWLSNQTRDHFARMAKTEFDRDVFHITAEIEARLANHAIVLAAVSSFMDLENTNRRRLQAEALAGLRTEAVMA